MKLEFPTRPVTKRLFNFHFAAFLLTGCALCALWACSPPPPENNVAVVSVGETPVDAVAEADVRDTAFMMERMSKPASMAVLYPSETVVYTSSHNTGELFDADVFQGTMEDDGKQWNLLFDEDGPGCITRVWLSGNSNGNLRFYFDGEEEPRIDAPVREFFSESYREFTSLIVYGVKISGGGNVCYMPMTYEKHCRIAIEAESKGAQYQVQAIHWDDDIATRSFTPQFDEKTTQAKADLFRYLSSTADQHFEDLNKRSGVLKLKPKSKKLLASLTGPGAIQFLQFTTDSYTMDTFMNLKITMYWDAEVEPAVDCTFAEFFNVVDVKQGWSIPAYGYLPHKKMLVTQFYMPFHEYAQIFIESTNSAPVSLNYEYRLALDDIADDAMCFYAQTVKTDGVVGYIYPAFQFDGKGRYVGCSVKTVSAEYGDEKNFYFEGDDYMYIDGEPNATIQGTGLDNYLNAYNRIASSVQFWGPSHGCRMKDNFQGGRSYCFRYHYLDSVPFNMSLLRIQEFGCPVQMSASKERIDAQIHVEWVHYWYGVPSKNRVVHNEQLFRFKVSDVENDAPATDSPLAIDDMLFIKMPPGGWWIHYAPIWDINQVQHVQKIVLDTE